jgi:hypothetical protein
MHNQFKNIKVGTEFVFNGVYWCKINECLATTTKNLIFAADQTVFSSLTLEANYKDELETARIAAVDAKIRDINSRIRTSNTYKAPVKPE